MNPMSDDDLQELDALLDDALSAWEAEQLRRRIGAEPALAAALDGLRADREVRRQVWQAAEPADAEAGAFARRVVKSARSRERWRRLARLSTFAAAAAACFVAGWVGKGVVGPARATPTGPPAVVQAGPRTPDSAATTAAAFQVVLTDEAGNVLAVQKFGGLEEARQFAGDLARWQVQQQQVRQGQMVLISDEF